MIFLRFILFPFSLIFALITAIRNWLFNSGVFKSVEFTVPVIGVGNLRVGGTGKTPHVEYLIRLFQKDYKIATLSRGYGRETRGFQLADVDCDARDIGDEPLQIFKKFGDSVQVSVCEDRALAIPRILSEDEKINLIILDDAFQHRFVKPRLNILLTSFDKPFYNDFLLPTGMLREPHYGARRADMIIVTKCPDEVSDDQKEKIRKKLTLFAKNNTDIFFTKYAYTEPVPFSEVDSKSIDEVFLISGLANSEPFEKMVESRFNVIRKKKFADHYDYYSDDIEEFEEWFKKHPNASLICTEKDYVKLSDGRFKNFFKKHQAYYIPIEVQILGSENDFRQLILDKIK